MWNAKRAQASGARAYADLLAHTINSSLDNSEPSGAFGRIISSGLYECDIVRTLKPYFRSAWWKKALSSATGYFSPHIGPHFAPNSLALQAPQFGTNASREPPLLRPCKAFRKCRSAAEMLQYVRSKDYVEDTRFDLSSTLC
jgi:hypothetical protein